jgi:hypothetical protein
MVLLPAPAGPSMAMISLRWDGPVIARSENCTRAEGRCDLDETKRTAQRVCWMGGFSTLYITRCGRGFGTYTSFGGVT